jgi:RNA polymerase sigma factor (sigma-70 family)
MSVKAITPAEQVERAYRACSERLWRGLLAFTGNREIASDAMAEAFARALNSRVEIREVEPWVWRTAFRLAARELREGARRTNESSDSPYELDDEVVDLLSALAKVSPKQRAALVLNCYAGYSTKEIAAIIHSSAAAVRVHLSRGRKRLRELLKEGQ